MNPQEQELSEQVKCVLESFLSKFEMYSEEINGNRNFLDGLRRDLQRHQPQVTSYILDIIGEGTVTLSTIGKFTHSNLLAFALMGGDNEKPRIFNIYESAVTNLLNRTIGAIETGLWPPKESKPILTIKDDKLKERCSDLLQAPGYFDRVIREATTVLEDRIRNKVPRGMLAGLIPIANDQTGDSLVNTLFSPNNPVLIISDNRKEQIAFYRVLLGIVSYLRNPHHHKLDDRTEWTWAWSIVGFIDKLLAEIETCEISKTKEYRSR